MSTLTHTGIAVITAAIDWAACCAKEDNASDEDFPVASQNRRAAAGRLRAKVAEHERTESAVEFTVTHPVFNPRP